MSGFSRGGNVRGGLPPINLDDVFGQPAGDRAPNGDLIDPNNKVKTLETGAEKPKSPDIAPPQPTGAELNATEKTSQEFRDGNQIQVLSGEIDDILNQVHSIQVAKIGGQKNNFADLIVRNLVRDVAIKLGKEQQKQDLDSLQGQVARLGEELKKLGPAMAELWQTQVSLNNLNLPN